MRKPMMLACATLMASGLWACDNTPATDAGVDSGPVRVDAGVDAFVPPDEDGGPPDAGTDAFVPPVETFEVRLVNNVPGIPGLEVCLWGSVAGSVIPATKEWLTMTLGPIPFRGVSPYRERELVTGLDFAVGLYRPSCDTAGCSRADPCPPDPFASGAAPAVVLSTIPGAALSDGARASAIATGLSRGTFGADATDLPARCLGATGFTEVCPDTTEARLMLVPDDQTAPAAGMARLRVSNQVPNLSGAGLLLCYDADLVPNPADGTCMQPGGGTNDPVALTTAPVAFGASSVTAYADVDPILPTIPAAGAGGGIYAAPPGAVTCPALPDGQRCYPILTAFPPPGLGSDNIRPHLAAGDISTIFISGMAALPTSPEPDYPVVFFIWQDNFVASGP